MTDRNTEKSEHFDVRMPDGFKMRLGESGLVTSLEAPRMEFDKYREMHIEYSERLGDAHKSIEVETCLTADEFFKFVREVMFDDRD